MHSPILQSNFRPGDVEIKTPKGKFSFPTMNPFDFPTTKEDNTEKIGTLGYDEILLIRKAVNFVAKDELRPILICVHIDDHIVGTDASTLAFYKILTPFKDYLMPSACVPLLDEKEVYTVQENEENIFLYGHNETLIHRKIEGLYPNWKQVIPTDFKANGFVNSEQLAESLNFASGVFENKYQQNVKFNFDFDFTSLDLKAECLDNGKKYETELDLKWQEKSISDLEIKFDVKRLSLILKVEKQEETEFSLTDFNGATIINDCIILTPVY